MIQFLTEITQNRLSKRFRESGQKIPMLFLMELSFELKYFWIEIVQYIPQSLKIANCTST